MFKQTKFLCSWQLRGPKIIDISVSMGTFSSPILVFNICQWKELWLWVKRLMRLEKKIYIQAILKYFARRSRNVSQRSPKGTWEIILCLKWWPWKQELGFPAPTLKVRCDSTHLESQYQGCGDSLRLAGQWVSVTSELKAKWESLC